jgi:ribosomal protein S18 acetylase RimI-like enzyme
MVKEDKVSGLKIRPYQAKDRKAAVSMLEGLKDFITSVDIWDIETRKSDYGEASIKKILKTASKGKLKIFLAETKRDGAVGLVVAETYEKTEVDRLAVKSKVEYGEITHLYIVEKYRRSGIGRKLMEIAEAYLKKMGCTHIRAGVFFPNVKAQKFYENLGYRFYNVEYIRKT